MSILQRIHPICVLIQFAPFYQSFGANPENKGTGLSVRQFPEFIDSNTRISCRFFQCQITFLPYGNFYHRQVSPRFVVAVVVSFIRFIPF